MKPNIAIVLPVYQHSALIREAIYSIRAQPEFVSVDVIIVDDGCPDPQTYSTLSLLPLVWSNVHYIRQLNGGLSVARNTGVAFILDSLPHAEAIYFLDADNLLSPYSLKTMQNALKIHLDRDWFYPDIRMFGIRSFHDYGGPFRRSVETLVNLCEAGSLVRRRVFEQGVRFDQSMRQGYEDWDFWLSAVECDFKGMHLPGLGLCYRKRAESMLADSHRVDAEIREYISRKHKDMFQICELTALEHDELPRFALVQPDKGSVRLFSDPVLGGNELLRSSYEEKFWMEIREPAYSFAGAICIVADSCAIDALTRMRMIRWVMREVELGLQRRNFVTLAISAAARSDAFEFDSEGPSSQTVHLIALSNELLKSIVKDEGTNWIESLRLDHTKHSIIALTARMPEDFLTSIGLKSTAIGDLVQFCLHLRAHPLRKAPWVEMSGVDFGAPPLNSVIHRARERYRGALPPIAAPRKGRVAFVVPICDFGGVEKVTFCVARELLALGFEPALIVYGKNGEIARFHAAREIFHEIFVIKDARIHGWAGKPFIGTNLPMQTESAGDVANLLSSYEIVLSCHSTEIMELMSQLKRRDVLTGSYLHLFDRTPHGRFVGHPLVALAYEYALDMVITCSDGLADEMAALGVPRRKLVRVPNAPSFEPNTNRRRQIQEKIESTKGPSLNILFIGRLDRQKGLDRLSEIWSSLATDENITLRIIGKAIIDDKQLDASEFFECVESPIYDNDGLSEAYLWADVLLLTSRYEGLPLTLLEAMSHAVVPIATNCGAIKEVIEDGIDGFVVPQTGAVETIISRIRLLETNAKMIRDMRLAAVEKMRRTTWNASVIQLVEKIDELRQRKSEVKAKHT